jgi:DNA-binding XRE family transcriptional regulator
VSKGNREASQTAVLDQVAPGSKIYTDEANLGLSGADRCLACQTHATNSIATMSACPASTHVLLVQLGKRIQSLRKGKGWTQTDLAVHLDMNRGHISNIEQGKREAGIITLQVIARGLDTTMANLLKGL